MIDCACAQAWAWQHESEGWRLSLGQLSAESGACGISRVVLPAMPSLQDFPELELLR